MLRVLSWSISAPSAREWKRVVVGGAGEPETSAHECDKQLKCPEDSERLHLDVPPFIKSI